MKIQEKYSKKFSQLTAQIETMVNSLGVTTYNMQLLNKKKNQLIDSIQDLNKDKQSLMKQILDEYGTGTLDPNTWQFTPQQNVKD